jgi:pilus assembly protein CpaE
MTWWAAEIKERIEAGENPDAICFTRKEIENNLQLMEKTGLYALLAPLTHEDSMDIGEAELQVMLRNIIENGGFDFVICDTGNNTRDSSVTALEAAEYVLLVVTQDITAANCNDAVLTTLNKIRFDTSKIRLIINNVLPAKITGVAVQEIEDLFPHPCIARIRHDTDVIRANNYSKPIVYNPNHEVTKEIRKIIAFLTGTNEDELVVKRGLLSRIFGK